MHQPPEKTNLRQTFACPSQPMTHAIARLLLAPILLLLTLAIAPAEITSASFGHNIGLYMDFNHYGNGPVYILPSDLSDELSAYHAEIEPHGNTGQILTGLASIRLQDDITTDTIRLSGSLLSRSESKKGSGPFADQYSSASSAIYYGQFTITQATSYYVDATATSYYDRGGTIAAISLYQINPYTNQNLVKHFDMGAGYPYQSGVPVAPAAQKSGVLQPGTYNFYAQAVTYAATSYNDAPGIVVPSQSEIHFNFELGDPAPPRLFAVVVGVQDTGSHVDELGQTVNRNVRGDLDANNVYGALSAKPNFADASLGNPQAPIILSQEEGGGITRIEMALSGMMVRPQDTVVFYFSGHGGMELSGTESPVYYKGNYYYGREFLAVGSENLYEDQLAAMFFDSEFDPARKVFILDACFTGGFDSSLSILNNYSLLAGADEGMLASGDRVSGQGNLTDKVFLPALGEGLTVDEIRARIGDIKADLITEIGGTEVIIKDTTIEDLGATMILTDLSMSLTMSDDFDGSQTMTGVPEPSTWALFGLGTILLSIRLKRLRAA